MVNEVLASTSDYSIFDLAEDAGFLLLNPSDLVFESNNSSINYYDYIISVARSASDTYQLYLAKLNQQTNVEWYESAQLPKKMLSGYDLPDNEITLAIIAVLTWKAQISKHKVLCLINSLPGDDQPMLQALKKTLDKLGCSHHVICFEKQYSVARITVHQCSMRLRVMMCEHRTQISSPPARAIREARCLLSPNFNPLCYLFLPFS
uniref:UDP-N-acetylmuramyl peptide synthase n=1 Tax=Syphacia muris TaxID=451379 RepID=A0A0N5AY49_9BILA